jgi:(1->4)-alpha-D-glucan 1-alpha-D-glucosylmutase
MLYQAIVGAWPLDLAADDAAGLKAFSERIAQWQRKALREAKRRSRWTLPNEPYEDACEAFLAALLQSGQGPARSLHAFVQRIAAAGAANSLAQTVLKLTTPGIPDIYQGTEFWDFSLVDPDNRRPVDFDARRSALAARASVDELLGHWRDGHLKQHVIHVLLGLRQRHVRLFANGSYRPLPIESSNDDPTAPQLFAFERSIERTRNRIASGRPTERADHDRLIVLVLRHTGSRLLDADTPGLSQAELAKLPSLGSKQVKPGLYRDVLTGRQAAIEDQTIGASAGRWLQTMPVAVLELVSE